LRPGLEALEGYHSPQVDVEVRLNTNESPYGPPAAWLAEFRAALSEVDFNRYPDRRALALRQGIAAAYGVATEEVFCANGSNEVLQSLLLAYGGPGRTVALFEPTYAMHRQIARITGTEVVTGWRGTDHLVDPRSLEEIVQVHQPVITFLCSPNNPTGRAEPVEVTSRALDITTGLVVVDEAYGQFAEASALQLREAAREGSDRIVVVRTFSKTWAMAGCRLGYLIADPTVVAACELVALPYHLDVCTQLAGRLALGYGAEMEQRVALLREERRRIATAFTELPVETWPSEANFLLFRPLHCEARQVWDGLLAASVLVRDCSTWPGLENCLRVTVGTREENDRFLSALAATLQEDV
jgi:histidinol-phosphate aminotransferase